MLNDFSLLIGGAAGEGSKKAGLIIAKFLAEYGYEIYIYEDYQSTIKGGHNFSLIRASEEKILSVGGKIDFLLALNEDTAGRHKKKLRSKNHLIFNSDAMSASYGNGIPIEKITSRHKGISIMKNTALVASFAGALGIKWETVKRVLTKELPISTDLNLKIAKDAFNEAPKLIKLNKKAKKVKSLVSGNEALALGALDAGLDAYVGYPMTPITGILNFMASVGAKHKLKVAHLENEISVINMAIGLAFSGNKTMIASSGGGFALMNEGLSLAAQSETPLIIVEGQRMGPSTGMPTYGGQTDLLYVLHSGHGDFEKFVIAPGDAHQAYESTKTAINVSWKFQIPSIVLADKDLCESTFSFEKDILKKELPKTVLWDGKGEYLRYKNTENGISPLAFPGDKNVMVKGTSYEHDERGITIDDEVGVKMMQDKRIKKYKAFKKEVEKIKCVEIYGDKKSKKAIIVWGLVKGVAIEAGVKLGFKVIQPLILSPFPLKQMQKALSGVKLTIGVEMSSIGQMARLMRNHGINIDREVLKYTGRPFSAEELVKKLSQK